MESDSEAYYRRFLRGSAKPTHKDTPMSRQGPSTRVKEIDGVDPSQIKNFPYSSLKLLGSLQAGLGVMCIVLGLVDLFLFLYQFHDYNNDTLSALTMSCTPVWAGLWFIMTGSMGTCMSVEQKSSLSYFKLTFMVLSLLCGVMFAPALLITQIYTVVLRSEDAEKAYEWILPLALAFFGLNEMVCAVITCGICCCCSALNQAKVRILYTTSADDVGPRDHKPRLRTPEVFTTDYSHPHRKPERAFAPASRSHEASLETARVTMDEGEDGPMFDARNFDRRFRHGPLPPNSPERTRYYSRPSTYDPDNQYHQLKRLTFPGDPNKL